MMKIFTPSTALRDLNPLKIYYYPLITSNAICKNISLLLNSTDYHITVVQNSFKVGTQKTQHLLFYYFSHLLLWQRFLPFIHLLLVHFFLSGRTVSLVFLCISC